LEKRWQAKDAGFDEFASFAAGITTYWGEWGYPNFDVQTTESVCAQNLVFSNDYLVRFPKTIFRDFLPALYSWGRLTRVWRDHLAILHQAINIWTDSRDDDQGWSGGDIVNSKFAVRQSPFFTATISGICVDNLLTNDVLERAAIMSSFGYADEFVRDAINAEQYPPDIPVRSRKRLAFILDNMFFGCDQSQSLQLSTGQNLLVNQLDIWVGFNTFNRVRYQLALPTGT
jgi:hypothetical protein